jgi:aryl-alcohol dehydrogenase-like predicted oxidoreductase
MRRVRLAGLDEEVSSLGFGCSSLGSRISSADGIRAAARAYDAGVTWFDVAPAYGGGKAESLLGEFVRTRRSDLHICTKVGLQAQPLSVVARTAVPAIRALVAAVPSMRRLIRAGPGSRNQAVELSAAVIASSIAESLKRLRTDYVDVLALHMPSPEAVARDDVLSALRGVLESGRARAVGVAGSAPSARIAAALGTPYSVIQLHDDPLDSPLPAVRAAFRGRPQGLVTHSIFGVNGAFARARERLARDEERLGRLKALGYSGSTERIAADVLLDRAFASNPDGVVLASMFGRQHLDANVARASRPSSSKALAAACILFD